MFGKKLKEVRIEKGMTQQQLADIVSVSAPMITQIERGTKQAGSALIADLAAALGVTPNELFGIEDKRTG